MLLSKEEIMQFLPHRDPFLFVDSIDRICDADNKPIKLISDFKSHPGMKLEAHFFLSKEHPILAGHFPGMPILPGVVQTEMIGQAACFMSYPLMHGSKQGKVEVALLGVDGARFRKPIYPDNILRIEVTLLKQRGKIQTHQGEIYLGETLMSEANILASLEVI